MTNQTQEEKGWEPKLDEELGLNISSEVEIVFGRYGISLEDNERLKWLKDFIRQVESQARLSALDEVLEALPKEKVPMLDMLPVGVDFSGNKFHDHKDFYEAIGFNEALSLSHQKIDELKSK